MAETLRELVVALSLDSSNFSRNMRTINQQNRAVEQYSRALVAANDKLKENYDRHKDYSARLEQAEATAEVTKLEGQLGIATEHIEEFARVMIDLMLINQIMVCTPPANQMGETWPTEHALKPYRNHHKSYYTIWYFCEWW